MKTYLLRARIALSLVFLAAICLAAAATVRADSPLWTAPGPYRVTTAEEIWHDAARNRDVPVLIYSTQDAPGPLPVVLFSHGLGGSDRAGEHWGRQWASWGIVSVHMQHHGSDNEAVRNATGTPMQRMRSAATAEQLIARGEDVKFVVSEIARRAASGDPALAHVDPAAIGLSGHSFGAQTTLAAAGEQFEKTSVTLTEPRLRAFIAFCPSALDENQLDFQFSQIKAPFLSLTGSRDQANVNRLVTPANRVLPFEHMAPGQKYLLFMDTATHMSFSGQQLSALAAAAPNAPDQNHIDPVIYAVTTAFWFAYLEPNSDQGKRAAAWLASGGPKALLNPADRWEAR